jgi:hypothetical protein
MLFSASKGGFSMKPLNTRITSFLLLFSLILLVACGPAASQESLPITEATADESPLTNNVSQTNKGVTITIMDVNNTLTGTVITFVVQADPLWNLSVDSDPPPVAMHNNQILTDETGAQYTPRASTYGVAQFDASTGGVKFENTITFERINSDSLTLQTEIEISGIPTSPPIEISLINHQVFDTWPLDPGISFSEFVDLPGNVRFTSRVNTKIELEFSLERIIIDGLKLGCLHFWLVTTTTPDFYSDCSLNESQVVSRLGMDLPSDEALPILVRVTGSAMILEPFTVSWTRAGE